MLDQRYPLKNDKHNADDHQYEHDNHRYKAGLERFVWHWQGHRTNANLFSIPAFCQFLSIFPISSRKVSCWRLRPQIVLVMPAVRG
jgi:hypothetical protein